jgi:hypothetical protein
MTRPKHEYDAPGESKSGLSGDNVDHFGSRYPKEVDPIYDFVTFLEFDSDNDCEIFMLGQGDAPANQTKQEIAEAAGAEIKEASKRCGEVSREEACIITGMEKRACHLQ